MPSALVVNPRRKSKRRTKRNVLINPRRRSRRRRRRRARRNPGIMRPLREVGSVAIPALLAGGAAGALDSMVLSGQSPIVRIGGKVAGALVLGLVGRKAMGPVATAAAMGAVLGTISYESGYKLGGGMMAPTKEQTTAELIEMAREDEELRLLIEEGLPGAGEDEMSAMGEEDANDMELEAMAAAYGESNFYGDMV